MPPPKIHHILHDVRKSFRALEVRVREEQTRITINEFFNMTTEVLATRQRKFSHLFCCATQSFYRRTGARLLDRRHF